jgi:hypothetical protein
MKQWLRHAQRTWKHRTSYLNFVFGIDDLLPHDEWPIIMLSVLLYGGVFGVIVLLIRACR